MSAVIRGYRKCSKGSKVPSRGFIGDSRALQTHQMSGWESRSTKHSGHSLTQTFQDLCISLSNIDSAFVPAESLASAQVMIHLHTKALH